MRTVIMLAVLGLFSALCAPVGWAAQLNITAVYSPDKSDPRHNTFVNTTPVSGYCSWLPNQCAPYGLFSIGVPIRFATQAPIDPVANRADPRQGAYFSMPTAFRTVTVTHEATGATADLQFRVAGFGGEYVVSQRLSSHRDLWTTWVNAPAPCRNSGVGVYSNNWYRFFWRARVGIGACSRAAKIEVRPPFTYRKFSFSYELVTPDPLGMDIGRYSGSLTLSVGPHQDIDFGDLLMPSDNSLTLVFDLAVNHLLKVDFPPGANRAILQPANGWQAWLNTGRTPPALKASQRFNLSSSGKFRMYLDCQYTLGDTCAIQLPSGSAQVPVDISVTLPHGVVKRQDRQPVRRQKLLVGSANAQEFLSQQVQFDRNASLDYDVSAASTAQMVANAGETYRGVATVVFDASF